MILFLSSFFTGSLSFLEIKEMVKLIYGEDTPKYHQVMQALRDNVKDHSIDISEYYFVQLAHRLPDLLFPIFEHLRIGKSNTLSIKRWDAIRRTKILSTVKTQIIEDDKKQIIKDNLMISTSSECNGGLLRNLELVNNVQDTSKVIGSNDNKSENGRSRLSKGGDPNARNDILPNQMEGKQLHTIGNDMGNSKKDNQNSRSNRKRDGLRRRSHGDVIHTKPSISIISTFAFDKHFLSHENNISKSNKKAKPFITRKRRSTAAELFPNLMKSAPLNIDANIQKIPNSPALVKRKHSNQTSSPDRLKIVPLNLNVNGKDKAAAEVLEMLNK